MNDVGVPQIMFGIVIIYGIYKLIVEPLVGGGKHHSQYNDRHHRR